MDVLRGKAGISNIRLIILVFVVLSGIAAALLYFPPVPTKTRPEITSGDIKFSDSVGNPINGAIELNGDGISSGLTPNVSYISWTNVPNARVYFNALDTKSVSVNFRISSNSPKGKMILENYGANMPGSVNLSAPGTPVKYVEISATSISFVEAEIAIKYTDEELNGLDENNLIIYQYDSGAQAWSELPAGIDASNNILSATVNSLSIFAVSTRIPQDIEVHDTKKIPVVSEIKTYDETKTLKKESKTSKLSTLDVPNRGELEVDAIATRNVAIKLRVNKASRGEIILDDFGKNNPVSMPLPGRAVKYVEIGAENISFSSANITIRYTDAELNGGSERGLIIYHWNGASWDALPTTVDTANNTLSATTMSLSPFGVAASFIYYLENNATIQSIGADGTTNFSASGTTVATLYKNLLKNGTGAQTNIRYTTTVTSEVESFRFYLPFNYSVDTRISANTQGQINWTAVSTIDTLNVSLIDYNPANGAKTVIGSSMNTATGGSNQTNYSFTIPNPQYTVHAGNKLIFRINTTTPVTGTVTLYFNDTSSYIMITETALGYNISGYVTNSSGLPQSGATVETNTSLNMTTNVGGFYNFAGLSNGTYIVNASIAGYITNSTIVTVNGDNVTNANISLSTPVENDDSSYAGYSLPVPFSNSWIPATSEQKSAISSIDSNRWETKLTTKHDQFDYQLYRFKVTQSVNNITNLTATWIGYGEEMANYDTYLYIWNNTISSWELLDTRHLDTEGTLNGTKTTNISSYVNGNGYVYLAAGAKHYNYAPPAPSGLSASVGYDDVTISWSPVIDQDGDSVQYYVEIVGNSNSGWTNDTSWYYFGLTPGWTYTYNVKARDNFISAESSAAGTFTTLKSSCPFVYGWNGSGYEYLTDLEGQVIGAPFFKVKDYQAGLYDIGTPKADNGTYKIKVRETIAEADYFDEAKLWVVDIPQGYNVYTDWHDVYIPGLPVTYNLYTVKDPKKPVSAYDRFGRDVLNKLEKTDDDPVIETLNSTNYYTLDFGNITHPEYAKLLVYGWNAFLKREGNIDPYKNVASYHEQNTLIEVINKSGEWQKVKEFGRLSGDLKPTVFNISSIWLSDDRRIRIHPAYSRFATMVIDKIELDDSTPVPVEVKVLKPKHSDLHHGGSDSYIYPNLKHRLHALDVSNKDSQTSYFYGNFTKYGDVAPLLEKADDMFVIMRHGDELKLEFPEVEEKNGSERKLFLYADVYYSIKQTVDGTFLRDTVEPLPFHGMSKYPYDTSVENYPYNKEHLEYLKEWNTRACEKGKNYCYDAKTGKEIENGFETLETFLSRYGFFYDAPPENALGNDSGTLHRSLNTNYVELKVNNQINIGVISNLNSSSTTSTGSFISWNNDVNSDNRVYYGLNETDVNNLVKGNWSVWSNNTINVNIRLSGLSANTTYYYKPQSWYSGTNITAPAKNFTTLKPGVWMSPAEYMVSPSGWAGSPANFRTINITAAPRNSNGRYISGLSLEAVIYNSTGSEIGRTNLSGNGPYSGNSTLPDYLNEGGYFVNITGYPLAGEFSILKWSCANCHSAGGGNYPSTFDPGTVHSKHFDTTNIYVEHPGPGNIITSTLACGNCHILRYPNWVAHPTTGGCSDCHKSPSGGNAALACENCHNDISTNYSYLSPRYGIDKHASQPCGNCHGNLTSLTTKPSCPTCHPRPGSNLTTVPDSIENKTHSIQQTVACGLCHNREHDIKTLGLDAKDCRNCHTGISHDGGEQCTSCHGSDPHKILKSGGPGCLGCHNVSNPRNFSYIHFIDGANFSLSVHASMNSNNASGYGINASCWACHNSSGTVVPNNTHPDRRDTPYICTDCHLMGGNNSGAFNAPIVSNHYKNGTSIRALANKTSDIASCIECHENTSEMVIPNSDPDYGVFVGDGIGPTGGNTSFYHYGKPRTDLRVLDSGMSDNCSYCHQNASTAFITAMIDPFYNSSISNHSQRYSSSNPNCTSAQCHNSGWIHNSTLTRPNLTLPNSSFCLGCHGDKGNGSVNYSGVTTGVKAMHNNSVNCTECHLNSSRSIHRVTYLQADASFNTSNSTGVNCITCHGTSKVDSKLLRVPPKIQSPLFHSDKPSNGTLWSQTGYWNSNDTITACIYCHNDTKHNATALGRLAKWKGNNVVNSSISSGSWCAGCHYQGYSSGGRNYGDMNSTFISAGLAVPPEITNGSYAPYSFQRYYNHSLTNYTDATCKLCHGINLTSNDKTTAFLHNITWGSCTDCHYSFAAMNITTRPDRYVNSTMFNASPHGSVACSNCHTKGHKNIGARKACEDCHAVQQNPKTDRDRHNITKDPWNYSIPGVSGSVVYITDCTACHDAGLYNTATSTYGYNKTEDCNYCHTYPDKTR